MDKGWISIHRKMQNHWLWEEKRVYSKAEAWIDLLLSVNHTEAKVLIKSCVYHVKRGQTIMSLGTLSTRWNWNKSKTRRFLKFLESESMIELKNELKTTRVTICKYDDYQQQRNANETRMKRKRNANETQMKPNNNDNNENNENNDKKEIVLTLELGEFENIKISKDDLNPLIEKYGQECFDWMVEKLGAWLLTKNKTVKNTKSLKAYFTNWVYNSYKENLDKNANKKGNIGYDEALENW